ncbi:MAG TPA: cobalt ECF transporter T component CbiQ [Thermodesulfovibrionales bacterium]|nr:cobalt ECF transporter T component CbiQ [Thermodesulfovibrionales bacterium]
MTFDLEFFNIGYLDTLSYRNSFVHRLDPRIKIIVSLIFILFVVSFPKYEISSLLPFFFYPVFLLTAGNIPLKAIAKKIFFISPFAVFIGIFNPLFDTGTMYTIFGVPVSGGWLSFLSILIKYMLTVSTALLLIAVTSFPGICEGLERLKLPKIFVIQLLFLYRYLFVLLEESLRMMRARDARSFGNRGKEIRTFVRLISVLLIRSIERAEMIFRAMLARGFRGEIKVLRRHTVNAADVLFLMISFTMFYIFRSYHVVNIMGAAFSTVLR